MVTVYRLPWLRTDVGVAILIFMLYLVCVLVLSEYEDEYSDNFILVMS